VDGEATEVSAGDAAALADAIEDELVEGDGRADRVLAQRGLSGHGHGMTEEQLPSMQKPEMWEAIANLAGIFVVLAAWAAAEARVDDKDARMIITRSN
jgi:hypothetical protein